MPFAIHVIFLSALISLAFLAKDRMIILPASHGYDYLDFIDYDSWTLLVDKNERCQLADATGKNRTLQSKQRDGACDQMIAMIPESMPVFIVADGRLSYRVIRKCFAALCSAKRCKINLVVDAR